MTPREFTSCPLEGLRERSRGGGGGPALGQQPLHLDLGRILGASVLEETLPQTQEDSDLCFGLGL